MTEPIAAPQLALALRNPVPSTYIATQPGVGGAIKLRPEDFLVDELPLYDPAGEGEHIYLGIEKRGVSHAELLAVLSRRFGVPRHRIGVAGMKDKQAITRQTVSLHLHKDPPSIELGHERIKVLWVKRHRNRLRRGHLRGNRFSIRIRDVEPTKAPAARAMLLELERTGVPNFYGPQRFGYRGNTHLLGFLVVKEQWQALAAELLGATGSPFPDHQREQRELFDEGKYAEALRFWSVADRAEKSVLQRLAQGATHQQAFMRLDRANLSFWVSALQSAVFNRVLEERLRAGTLGTLLDGDLAWRHQSGSVFRINAEELAKDELPGRLSSLEISPSGPIWGGRMTRAAGAVDEVELAALNECGVTAEEISNSRSADEGGRRPLRIPIRLPEIDAGVDEHGGYIRLAFELPPGAYATIVTREIMKNVHEEEEAE